MAIAAPPVPLDALLEEVRVKFSGTTTITGTPKIDDRMAFVVHTVCKAFTVQRGNSGELIPTATMEIVGVEVKSGPTSPTGAPDLFTDGD